MSSFVYVFLRVSGEFHAFIRALTGSEGRHATQRSLASQEPDGNLEHHLKPPRGLRKWPFVAEC